METAIKASTKYNTTLKYPKGALKNHKNTLSQIKINNYTKKQRLNNKVVKSE